jgi:hypothetical protein
VGLTEAAVVWAFRLFTAVVLFAHGAVFLYTLGPAPDISIGETWPLLVAAIASWAMLFVGLSRTVWPEIVRAGMSPAGRTGLWHAIPWTARVITPVGAVVLFALFAGRSSGRPIEGSPDRRDGQPAFVNHGRVVRKITEDEFRQAQIDQVQDMTSIGLLFTWIAASVLWAVPTNRFDDH